MAYDEFTAKTVRKCSELEKALVEKDEAYQQLMAQAVSLAETVLQGHRHRLKTLRIVRANASITLADKFLNSPEAKACLKEREAS